MTLSLLFWVLDSRQLEANTESKILNEEDLLRVSEILRAHESWCIFTHRNADGDAVGSAAALYSAGLALGKKIKWYSPDENLPANFSYLENFDKHITCNEFVFDQDAGEKNMLYIFLDCSAYDRSVKGFAPEKNFNALNIDHHMNNGFYARVNCVDSAASSACEILFRIFKVGDWEITRGISESLYTGIVTDTGGFSFSNTSPLTHKIAAELISRGVAPAKITNMISQNKTPEGLLLWARAMSRVKFFGPENIFALTVLYASDFQETGADATATGGLANMLLTIRGVKFISIVTEYPNKEIDLNIRSREGSPFGAAEFAKLFGGGGHEKAAGATLKNIPIEKATEELENLILKKYHERSCAD